MVHKIIWVQGLFGRDCTQIVKSDIVLDCGDRCNLHICESPPHPHYATNRKQPAYLIVAILYPYVGINPRSQARGPRAREPPQEKLSHRSRDFVACDFEPLIPSIARVKGISEITQNDGG